MKKIPVQLQAPTESLTENQGIVQLGQVLSLVSRGYRLGVLSLSGRPGGGSSVKRHRII